MLIHWDVVLVLDSDFPFPEDLYQ